MKKVGIITVHKNTNYGANLQAFASNKYVNKIGCDCAVVDYSTEEHDKSNHVFSWLKQTWDNEKNKTVARKMKLFISLAFSIGWKRKRLKAFYKFRKQNINLSKECRSKKDIQSLNLDAIICGSDQIWNPTITGGVNPIFYGDINGIKNKISYAASVGKSKLEIEEERAVIKLIEKLDYCSVREEQTSEYLSGLTKKRIETVCDPVFLLEKSDYEEIISKRLIKKEYVLLYSVVQNAELTKIAAHYAKENNLELIEICAGKNRHAKHKQICVYGPSEFLSSIKHAKTVFTNSFHGTAFSIIFEKDFYVVDNENGGSRITNLLNKAGIRNRLVSSTLRESFNDIDYDQVKNNLRSYINDSKIFLDNALKTEKTLLAGFDCVSCGACYAVCNNDAIRLIKNEEGFLGSLINNSKCKDCNLCKQICPALNDVSKNPKSNDVWAFKANDETRKKSASGGAFMALAERVIKQKGVIYGAVQNQEFSVAHVRVENLKDLTLMQGTKYVVSDISDCYTKLVKDLNSGKTVLFSGTPCQIDAVNRYVKMRKLPIDNLYTIDIICHGVPSPTIYDEYIEWMESKEKSKIIEYKFRSKKLGWRGNTTYVKFANGKELFNDKKSAAYMNLYYSNNVTRNSCYSCNYTTHERVSDITISDYWGIEKLDKTFEDELGVSMVIVNSDKGKELFTSVEGDKLVGNIAVANQPQLTNPVSCQMGREAFWEDFNTRGIEYVVKKYGGAKRDSLKTVLYKLKKKIFR